MVTATSNRKKPTLRTISELSGLAVPTVSRALNDAPDIGKDTKARVREIARQIGYVPNRAGVRLRTGKTNVISLVLGTDNEVTDHTGQLISSIARALRDTPYHMVVTPYFPEEDPMIPVRYIVETQSADAVILNRIEINDPRVAYLMKKGFPFVSFGRSKWRNKHPYFDFDNGSFGRIAADELVSLGCRSITMLAPPLEQSYASDMVAGANEALSEHGLNLEVLEGISGDDPGEVIQSRIAKYLEQNPGCDALICPSTTAAISAIVGAERVGREIGKDLHVFAKEGTPFLRYFRKTVGTVREDVRAAGEFLAKAAVRAIEDPTAEPLQRLIEATCERHAGENRS
ncbi:MAG: LacI family transcriptional regulator [Paracoccaceae bacterium]|nr:LacI family transcriptional regulator [Paracoccaceae bacterium]